MMYDIEEMGSRSAVVAAAVLGFMLGFCIFHRPAEYKPTVYNKVMNIVKTYSIEKCKTQIDSKPDICIKNLIFNLAHDGEFREIEFTNDSDLFMTTSSGTTNIREHFSEDQLGYISEALQERMDDFNKIRVAATRDDILKNL